LGYSLLQEGQPIAYGARGLTSAEHNYAQIEKEMLAIVVGCGKFDQYIYGCKAFVETDHKPLVSITKSQFTVHQNDYKECFYAYKNISSN